MNNSIPRINEDKIIRHIDEGDKHVLVPKLILNQKNINLNVSAYLMYSVVDGKKNINELCDEMLKTFRGVTKDNLVDDVMDFYMSLWRIGILSWDVNPYPEKYSKHIGDWIIRYISTDDVKEYIRICDKSTEEYINPYRYKDQLTGVDNMLQSIVNNAMFCFAVTHECQTADYLGRFPQIISDGNTCHSLRSMRQKHIISGVTADYRGLISVQLWLD